MSDDDDKENKGQGNGPQPPFDFRKNRFALILFLVVIGLLVAIFLNNDFSSGRPIPYTTFLDYLNRGDIESVEIVDQTDITFALANRSGSPMSLTTRIPY